MASEVETELKKRSPVGKKYGGTLRDHWNIEWPIRNHMIQIINNVFYLPWQIRGTGIYGPYHQPICASGWRLRGTYAAVGKPRYLHWIDPQTGVHIFRHCVRGIKPNPFVEEAIEAGTATAFSIIKGDIEAGAI
jgi:hypothetical protein